MFPSIDEDLILLVQQVPVTSNHLILVKAQERIVLKTFIFTASVLIIILTLISFWIPLIKPDSEKLSPYECGFDPLGSARLPYSIRFFLVAILFLLFDLEIALLLPSPWATQIIHPPQIAFFTYFVLLLLTLGFVYEWYQGGLEWAE